MGLRSRHYATGPPVLPEILFLSVLVLGWLALAIALEVVSEDLLKKYRETADSPVVDPVDLGADHVLRTVAQGYHQFAQGRLRLPVPNGRSFMIIDEKP